MPWQRHCLTLLAPLLLLSASAISAPSTPDDLPLPADQVMYLPDTSGEDIGLPLGATSAYSIGRSLQRRGETEAALVYLHRANRLAPGSPRIAKAYAQCLVDAGFVNDAARIFGELVGAAPDSLDQRRKYALILAQAGRPRLALQQVQELKQRGVSEPMLTKLEADLLGQLGRVDEAIAVYHEARREDPDRTEEYILAAGALLQRNERFDEMAELLRDGLEVEPTSQPMRLSLIRYLVHAKEVDEARREATAGDAARREAQLSSRPDCTLELSELLARRGDFASAVSILEDAREEGIRDRELETLLARYLLGLGNVEAALSVLPDAADHWPQDGSIRYLWGRALEIQNDIDGALGQLRIAVELEPAMALYRISLLRLLVISRPGDLGAADPTPAQAALQEEARGHAAKAAVTVHPQDAEGHMILGYVYRSLGNLDRACRHFQLAGEVNENRVGALLELGFCQQEAGRLSEARKTLHNLQVEFPDDPEVANSYGYLLAEMSEDLDRAEKLVRQALATDPENGAYLDSLGWVFFQRGEYTEAFEFLVQAANARPDDPVILEHLGRTLGKQGQADQAIDVLRRSLAAGGDQARLQTLIGELEDAR